ncbi:MAG: toll/interleukin-1 receptor domain-containing protein [Candidatus Binataceae bacterium]
MAHDVFISHSARDKPAADAVCAKLESRGIRCWIAPRDIRPGMSWGGAIIEAIDGARVMVLLFSSHANDSPQIKREVERAVHRETVIIPVRVEEVQPTGDFEYFLGTPHWLDAITPPFEQHLEHIAESTKFWLDRIQSGPPASATEARPAAPLHAEPRAYQATTKTAAPSLRWLRTAITVLAVSVLSIAAFFGGKYYLASHEQPREQIAEQKSEGTVASGAASQSPAEQLSDADARIDPMLHAILAGTAPELAGQPDPGDVDAIRKAAESGDPDQQWRLGSLYNDGLGVKQDYGAALDWYRKSAARGNEEAEWRLGTMYANGWGVAKDPIQAVDWYRKSAEKGNSYAEYYLGSMYESGRGVPKNYTQAVNWYAKSAAQSNSLGQNGLGTMSETGLGVPKNYDFAVSWFHKAAAQGNSYAEFYLGVMYLNGFGVDKDYSEAVSWYRKAAARGNSYAELNLGVMYENGLGVDKDRIEAINWYEKSAGHGNNEAVDNLDRLRRTR